MKNDTLKILVTSDIHYGMDYSYTPRTGDRAGMKSTILGSWGRTVMPRVIERFHGGRFDLLLDGGDKISDHPAVFASGELQRWHKDLHSLFNETGRGRFLDVKGNHCVGVETHMGDPAWPRNADFPSSYKDINGFRIVMSNPGTRQRSSAGRFIPTEHFYWLDEVVGKSPHPVIFLQHIPPDEFDNGDDYYERLAGLEMVALVLHGHRHEPAAMEFPHGVPVLHMQALLFEEQPGQPGAHIAEIECDPDKIRIAARALMGTGDADKVFTIDRRDLSLLEASASAGYAAPTPF